MATMLDNALRVNPRLATFTLSAGSGDGLAAGRGWLRDRLANVETFR